MEKKELNKSQKIIRMLKANGANDVLINKIFAFLVEKSAINKEDASEMLLYSKITPDVSMKNTSKEIDEFYDKEIRCLGIEKMKEVIDKIYFMLHMLGIDKEKMDDKKWLKEKLLDENDEEINDDEPFTNEDEILKWVTFIIGDKKLKYNEASSIFLSAFERGDISKNQCNIFLRAVAEYDGFEKFNYEKFYKISNLFVKLNMNCKNNDKTNVVLDIMTLLYKEKLIEYDCLLGIILDNWAVPFM